MTRADQPAHKRLVGVYGGTTTAGEPVKGSCAISQSFRNLQVPIISQSRPGGSEIDLSCSRRIYTPSGKIYLYQYGIITKYPGPGDPGEGFRPQDAHNIEFLHHTHNFSSGSALRALR